MIIMYHQVNLPDYFFSGLGHFPFSEFKNQIEALKRSYSYSPSIPEAFNNSKFFYLTFDDGLKGHIDCVAPYLKRTGLTATFYASSMPLITGQVCNVHLAQLSASLLSYDDLSSLKSDLISHVDLCESEIFIETYENQSHSLTQKHVKSLVNYHLSYEVARDLLLKYVTSNLGLTEETIVKNLYMTVSELKELKAFGFNVFPHFHSHQLLGKLSLHELKSEFEVSLGCFLEIFSEAPVELCIPFGMAGSWNRHCHDLCEHFGVKRVITVSPIEEIDASISTGSSIEYFHRLDCNQFPHAAYMEFPINVI